MMFGVCFIFLDLAGTKSNFLIQFLGPLEGRVSTCIGLFFSFFPLRVEFLLKTDSGYPRDVEVTLFTLASPFFLFFFWKRGLHK